MGLWKSNKTDRNDCYGWMNEIQLNSLVPVKWSTSFQIKWLMIPAKKTTRMLTFSDSWPVWRGVVVMWWTVRLVYEVMLLSLRKYFLPGQSYWWSKVVRIALKAGFQYSVISICHHPDYISPLGNMLCPHSAAPWPDVGPDGVAALDVSPSWAYSLGWCVLRWYLRCSIVLQSSFSSKPEWPLNWLRSIGYRKGWFLFWQCFLKKSTF